MAKPHDGVGDEYTKKCRKTAMQELDDYLTDPQNHLHKFIDVITRSVKEANDESKQLKEHFAKESQVIQKHLAESEKDRERYRKERNDLRTEIEKFSREAKQTVVFKKQEQLRREIEELQNLFEQKNKEWERKLKESEDSSDEIIRVQKQKIERYEQDIKTQKIKVKDLEELMEKSRFSFGDIAKLRKKLDETEKQLNDTNDRLVRVSVKLKETEKELDDTKTRLSKSMGDKLTDNNPSIADLSDKNRPTKLAEKYTELYDNQWTDAFEQIQEEVHSDNDKEIINILLQILLDISDFCNRRVKRQMDDLKKALLCSDSTADGSIPDNVTKQLKDCRKATSMISKDRVFQLYLTSLRAERGQLKKALKVSSFVKECIEICWLMANQDPPVVFGETLRRGEVLNTEVFKAYLKNGPYIDFIVWPAMHLHKGGPVLAKGVAQGYDDKIQRRKECWTEEKKAISAGSRFASSRNVRGTDYNHGRSSHNRTPESTVYVSRTKTSLYPEVPRSESTYIHKESHQRTRSAEDPKRTFTKTTESFTKAIPETSYEREPSIDEMKRFFYYNNRGDFISARNILGDKVYNRCWQKAYMKFEYC